MAENITVCCRFRPINDREHREGAEPVVDFGDFAKDDEWCRQVSLKNAKRAGQGQFTFDRVFPAECGQDLVYRTVAESYVHHLLSGFNCTLFAYGQTGSGKTHTMMGVAQDPSTAGVIPRLSQAVFDEIERSSDAIVFTVKVSIVEIYMEKLRDLLEPGQGELRVRESGMGVWIEGVSETYVTSREEVLALLERSNANRATSGTQMNDTSSRSHSVVTLTVGQLNKATGAKKGAKLTLVDLAGSEKVRKSGATGDRLQEAMHINKSLSALGNVINALSSRSAHVPYRDSKLTRLLTDSLGGNSKTCLIITCTNASFNADETLSTLRFGTRAKHIKNKPRVNQELSVAEYKVLLRRLSQKHNALLSIVNGCQACSQRARSAGAVDEVSPQRVGEAPDDSGGSAAEVSILQGRLEALAAQHAEREERLLARVRELELEQELAAARDGVAADGDATGGEELEEELQLLPGDGFAGGAGGEEWRRANEEDIEAGEAEILRLEEAIRTREALLRTHGAHDGEAALLTDDWLDGFGEDVRKAQLQWGSTAPAFEDPLDVIGKATPKVITDQGEMVPYSEFEHMVKLLQVKCGQYVELQIENHTKNEELKRTKKDLADALTTQRDKLQHSKMITLRKELASSKRLIQKLLASENYLRKQAARDKKRLESQGRFGSPLKAAGGAATFGGLFATPAKRPGGADRINAPVAITGGKHDHASYSRTKGMLDYFF